MRTFEFVLRKVYCQNGIRIFLIFFLFMFPTNIWKSFVELFMFTGLLPRDIEHGDEEISLQFPIKRWQLFLYDFFSGAIPLLVSGLFVVALSSSKSIKWLEFQEISRSFLTMPYIYALCVLSAKYLRSHFIIPQMFLILDLALCNITAWRYISPLRQSSFISALISLCFFITAAFLYSEFNYSRGVRT